MALPPSFPSKNKRIVKDDNVTVLDASRVCPTVIFKDKHGMKNKEEINRILITLNVVGSVGPFRFVVREDELVSSVVDISLKAYAREGRRPLLGSDLNCFALYCAYSGGCALSPWEPIGSFGSRSFLLCLKQSLVSGSSATPGREIGKKAMFTGWKAWINRSTVVTKLW